MLDGVDWRRPRSFELPQEADLVADPGLVRNWSERLTSDSARDRLYVGNEDGAMTVLRTGPRTKELSKIEMDAPLFARPALIGDSLLVVTANRLYRIEAR